MTTSHHGRSSRASTRAKTERPRKPSKIQPILLDRLAHALAAQGVSLKRTAVLQVAAAAFGYHNANEFSAADLVVPQARAIARATMPTGDSVILVEDPLAQAPYGIDEAFLEQVIAENRRESFGISPYGHLLDLTGLADQNLSALGQSAPPAGLPLHIAVIEHKHGSSGYVAQSKTELYAQLAAFCVEYWREAERRAGPLSDYEDDKAIVDAYFEGHDSETLYLEEAALPTVAPARMPSPRITLPNPSEEHRVFRAEHYRDFCKLMGQSPSYAEWVAEQVRAQETSLTHAPWMRSSFADLRRDEVVVVNIHYVGGTDLEIRPGQLALINHVQHEGGGTQVGLRFADRSQVLFDSRDRGGYLPFQRAECAFVADPPTTVRAVWMQARSAATLKAGDRVSLLSDITIDTGRILKGTELRISAVSVSDGFLNLRCEVDFSKTSFVIRESLTRGIFPLLLERRAILEAVMHTEEDWREAVAQRATGASYETWASERRLHNVHLKEKWLNAAEVSDLKPEQELVIRIHGSGTAYNDESGEAYEAVYAPGDTVIVDEIVDMHDDVTIRSDEGLILHCRTTNDIQIALPIRNGYVPVAFATPEPEKSATPATPEVPAMKPTATPTLLTGTPVHRQDGEILTVVAIATEQPLEEQGLVLFRGENDLVHIAGYAPSKGHWYLYAPTAITHDMLRALGRPPIDETIEFDGVDCHIEAADFPADQPLAASGIFRITDQYRETHLCGRDGDRWVVVRPEELSPAQFAAVEDLI